MNQVVYTNEKGYSLTRSPHSFEDGRQAQYVAMTPGGVIATLQQRDRLIREYVRSGGTLDMGIGERHWLAGMFGDSDFAQVVYAAMNDKDVQSAYLFPSGMVCVIRTDERREDHTPSVQSALFFNRSGEKGFREVIGEINCATMDQLGQRLYICHYYGPEGVIAEISSVPGSIKQYASGIRYVGGDARTARERLPFECTVSKPESDIDEYRFMFCGDSWTGQRMYEQWILRGASGRFGHLELHIPTLAYHKDRAAAEIKIDLDYAQFADLLMMLQDGDRPCAPKNIAGWLKAKYETAPRNSDDVRNGI